MEKLRIVGDDAVHMGLQESLHSSSVIDGPGLDKNAFSSHFSQVPWGQEDVSGMIVGCAQRLCQGACPIDPGFRDQCGSYLRRQTMALSDALSVERGQDGPF